MKLSYCELIPRDITNEHRAAAALAADRPVSRTAAVVIALIWAASIALTAWLAYRYLSPTDIL